MSHLELSISHLAKGEEYCKEGDEEKDKYTDYMYDIFVIVSAFLQPGGEGSAEDIANRVIDLYPDKHEMEEVQWVCMELASQIPYHHPSQQKLVDFVKTLLESEKRMAKTEKDGQTVDRWDSLLYVQMYDCVGIYTPRSSKADEQRLQPFANYPNFQAFLTLYNADSPNVFQAKWALDDAFEERGDDWVDYGGTGGRDAVIIGAAQWILRTGQQLFSVLTEEEGPSEMTPAQWKKYKQGFRDAASGNKARTLFKVKQDYVPAKGFPCNARDGEDPPENYEPGEECKAIANRAATLMDAIEVAMTF